MQGYECVAYYECGEDGTIITDGAGLIGGHHINIDDKSLLIELVSKVGITSTLIINHY